MIACQHCKATPATVEVEKVKFNGDRSMSILCTDCFSRDKWDWINYKTYTYRQLPKDTKDNKTNVRIHTYVYSDTYNDYPYTTI